MSLVDQQDRTYSPSADGQAAYESINGTQPDIRNVLGPGESFTTTAIFDIPADIEPAGLKVDHGVWPGRLIIGESSSFFHKRTLLMLK